MTGLSTTTHQGYDCLRLAVQQGTALVALHGGQVLSWTSEGGTDAVWLSPQSQQPPAAIRGGVPLCWPWFGKQGMPEGAMQHGPVRNRPWQVVGTPQVSASRIQLELAPQPAQSGDDPLARYAHGLDVRLSITLDATLTLALQTQNNRATPFTLTQALHTYLAVDDVRQIRIDTLARLPYDEKLTPATGQTHAGPWRYDGPCDRVYQADGGAAWPTTHVVIDPIGQRQIQLETQGSRSVVLWNPGPEGARAMTDVPDTGWPHFICLETSNAGTDSVQLPPGARHVLRQRLSIEALPGF